MTAATAQPTPEQFAASESETPLPLRGDTFLGVFEAIGQDLGIHANWFRVPFAALILWNPVVIIGAYLALGCVVAAARWLFPRATTARGHVAPAVTAASAETGTIGENRESEELLAA